MQTAGEGAVSSAPRSGRAPKRQSPASLLNDVLAILDDAKAESVTTIELKGKSSIADHMVIASGRSQRHVGAIADQLVRKLKETGHGRARIEGLPHCDWVLIDTGDVIVHIFRPEVREFYNLEKMWSAPPPEDKVAV
ncbi:MAG: ribosome silencing factor [Alphaproteobacteria bacterium]|nr:MAG: ribosome silencing factor [Alphaproteobacteria bacterium]